MTYCDNQALREEMYRAYSTRASDQGPNAGKWNSKVMGEILALRHELAQLLGFGKTTPSNHLPLKWQKTRSRCWIS
ncbi:M3 family metallopeptidase [Escherichia coli]